MKLFRLCFTNGLCTDWALLGGFSIQDITRYVIISRDLFHCYNYYIEYKEA